MRTHHNLAEVAGRYKDRSVMPLAEALTGSQGETLADAVYNTAHYDPIVLGFILGRHWYDCKEEALAAVLKDLEYDYHLAQVAINRPKNNEPPRVVKGLDVSKLEFKL